MNLHNALSSVLCVCVCVCISVHVYLYYVHAHTYMFALLCTCPLHHYYEKFNTMEQRAVIVQ